MHRITLFALLLVISALCVWSQVVGGQTVSQDEEHGAVLDPSEELLKKYVDGFRENGVPTRKAVDAALKQANDTNTLESWEMVARLANKYANVVDVLYKHYWGLYRNTDGPKVKLGFKAVPYEKKSNEYRGIRNDAYIRIAKLHLKRGDKAQALSYAVTAVELSAAEPNEEGEALILEIIEFNP